MTTDPVIHVKKPKTKKGKRVLEQREPQIVEDVKHAAFVKGSTANDAVMKVMKDLNNIKKPHTVFLNKKNDFRPFEDVTGLEFLVSRSQCGLFAFASHSRKRPTNMVMGRTYDDHVLDMFEFGVENIKLMQDFKNTKISVGAKPLLMFAGEAFDTQPDYIRMKNFFTDFFTGVHLDGIRLAGVENIVSFVAKEGKIHFRHFKTVLLKSGATTPRVELEEIGPCFDLVLRRTKLASDDLFKLSLKQPYLLKPKVKKNVSISDLGTTFGRVHLGDQDFSKLAVKHVRVKGQGKRKTPTPFLAKGGDMEKVAELDRMNPIKKMRRV